MAQAKNEDGAEVTVKGITVTWPKLLAVVVSFLATCGGIVVWGGGALIDDRTAQIKRVDDLDAYVHVKGSERDVFAAHVSEQLCNLAKVQTEMKAVDLDTNAKIDRINDKLDRLILGQKNMALALGAASTSKE